MKFAFLVNQFPLLSETFILNQITGLIDRGHTVDIFARGPARDQPKQHQDVARYSLRAVDLRQDALRDEDRRGLLIETLGVAVRHAVSSPALFRTCISEIRLHRLGDALRRVYPIAAFRKRGPYDVVHAHYGMNGVWAVRLRKDGAFDSKIATTFHDGFDLSTYLAQHGPDAYCELFEQGDLILPISDLLAKKLQTMGCPPDRIAVHRVGVELVDFPARQPLDATQAPSVRILSVARLVEMKGLEYGIRAVAALRKELPGIRYVIAGDGPLRRQLNSLIGHLGLREQVQLRGWQSQTEVRGLLGDTDIFLAPSVTGAEGVQEGIPTVLMEAMAARLPVVATGYSGTPELVRDRVDGLLIKERDLPGIMEALRQLATDPAARMSMGNSGHNRVAQLHDIDRLNDQLVDRYQELIGTRSP